jgi:hypothetical protein
MLTPQHTDAASCDLGASCPRARLLADLDMLTRYAARLAADWDARHLTHVGHLAESASRTAWVLAVGHDEDGNPVCGDGEGR